MFYNIDERYKKAVAYFSMEFAIHQPLKNYAGGLGFLAGSHLRSSFDLHQKLIGIGILWSYGYYDQERHEDGTLKVAYHRKNYYFLKDTGVSVKVKINGNDVVVKSFLLKPKVFGSAPLILLTTDCEENDYLARTTCYHLYDANEKARIAQEIVLGIGGVKTLNALGLKIDTYHMNEGHSLPLAFELLREYKNLDEVKKRVVFTTHTPIKAGNESHNIDLLEEMGFFAGLSKDYIQKTLDYYDNDFCLTVGALKVSKKANAVSKIHKKITEKLWANVKGKCEIISITNAQNMRYWADKELLRWMQENEDYELMARKKHLKKILFEEVADQVGKIFDENILTLVWARRFIEYKRPWLLKYDIERFRNLVNNKKYPIQIIWAGKPYPLDMRAINMFNELVLLSKEFKNVAVLYGYELKLSKLLKQGSDLWLNTPRWGNEASGTSGMSAAANASIHFSVDDGWHAEFGKDEINSFTIFHADPNLPKNEIDRLDYLQMMDKLENIILPMYYENQKKWINIAKRGMNDVMDYFDSNRMVKEYYEKLY